MKLNHLFYVVLLPFLALASSGFSQLSAQTTIVSMAPLSVKTQQGATSGTITDLAIQDQSDTQDDSNYYVRLKTPKSLYRGQFVFRMPSEVDAATIQSIVVDANFRGPSKSIQTWTWELYDWSARKWILLGDNADSDGIHWLHQTFTITGANLARFTRAKTGEMRARLTSSKLKHDSLLDYLRIQITTADAAPAPATPTPVGQAGKWNLVFSDEFDDSSLDLTKWQPNWRVTSNTDVTKPVNTNEANCYDPSQVTETAGELRLTTVEKDCLGYRYASGLVETDGKFNFTYGAMEARVWLPDASGRILGWPAFWANGQRWPKDGEIDVLEGMKGEPCFYFHNSPPGRGGCVSSANGWAPGWHTYGANWQKGRLDFYYDSVLVWTYTRGITRQPMFLILNMSVNKNDLPTGLPITMRVDYVRVWQPAP